MCIIIKDETSIEGMCIYNEGYSNEKCDVNWWFIESFNIHYFGIVNCVLCGVFSMPQLWGLRQMGDQVLDGTESCESVIAV